MSKQRETAGSLDRRDFLRAVALGTAALGAPEPARAGESRPPNIVYIMADDLGAECLGCYGSTDYETPRLDALAAEGVRFENAYSTPLCTPTRVMTMTGQYPFRNGWPTMLFERERPHQFMETNQFTFGDLLQSAGYATAVAGKWQLAHFEDRPFHPKDLGFDEHCLWTWLYPDEPPGVRMEGKRVPSRYWDPGIWQNGALLKETKNRFGPDIFTDFLIDFMRRNRERPFFAYFPMALTHWPFVPPPGMDGDKGGTRKNPVAKRNFAAMVKYMDRMIGRIVDALDEMELREDTLLVFTGDNGTARELTSYIGEEAVRGEKGHLTEAGTRVPLIANWPGVTPAEGAVSNDLVDLTDPFATFAEAAGVRVPAFHYVDGRSFLPQLRGQPGNPREWVFCQLRDDWFIRSERWRLHKNGDLADMQVRYEADIVEPPLSPVARAAKDRLENAAKELLNSTGEER